MHMKTNNRPRTLRKAFFLTLTVANVVTALACPGTREEPRREHAQLELRNLRSALKHYKEQVGHYPTLAEGLNALVDSGILTSLPKDSWGNDYVYTSENGKVI